MKRIWLPAIALLLSLVLISTVLPFSACAALLTELRPKNTEIDDLPADTKSAAPVAAATANPWLEPITHLSLFDFYAVFLETMEGLHQNVDFRMKWMEDGTAMGVLTDNCYGVFTVSEQNIDGIIESCQFAATFSDMSEMVTANLALIAIIYALDRSITLDFAGELAMSILPEAGTYISANCYYIYVETDTMKGLRVYML